MGEPPHQVAAATAGQPQSRYGAGLLDPAAPLEQQRLLALESFADPSSRALLAGTGLSTGWRCLEVGAGAGSMAHWLADRAAPGEVVATDLDVGLLPSDVANLTVLRHDVTRDGFPDHSFDLVHARAVLEHLPGRDAVISRMTAWVKPTGWLCLEAALSTQSHADDCLHRSLTAISRLATQMGVPVDWAADLPHIMAAQGLIDIHVTCTPALVGAGHAANNLIDLTLQRLAPALLDTRMAARDDLDQARQSIRSPHTASLAFLLLSARGRKPTT